MVINGIYDFMEYIEKNFGLGKTMESGCVRYTLPIEMGEGYFELFQSQKQYQIWITHAQTKMDIDMTYLQDENTYMGLSYIETESVRMNPETVQTVELQQWKTSRSLPSSGMIHGICKANIPIHAVNLILFQDFFLSDSTTENSEDYFDFLKIIQNFDEQTFMSELYPVLAEILHCVYKGDARALFMKSRAYDIAARLISLCDTEHEQTTISLSKFDIGQIRSIPAIFMDTMANPPSISALSRMTALNEFKLKAGFKKVFHITVYEYLRQLRTEKAIELMKEELTLEKIAEKIGYKSMRGFSQAFMKCTGITPAEWRKQRSTSFIL